MQARLGDSLPLNAIAAQAGLDRRRIERLFRAVLGQAPAAHYRDLRLRHGLGLMRQQGLGVQQAALASGFSSQTVFSRACKQHFGASPRTIAQRVPGG